MDRVRAYENDPVLQRIRPKGIPLLYGDEDFEMGETAIHNITTDILLYGLAFHFARAAAYRVYGNLNLYYSDEDPNLYVSPDVMVIKARRGLPKLITSYRIGEDGPGPTLVSEVLSFRTWQQGDLTDKPMLYSDLGVDEYIVADVTGDMLEQRLLLLRRQTDGRWRDEQDPDGGITSRLGFRVLIEEDGQLRVLDTKSGKRYARPDEAQEAVDTAAAATDRARALEVEVERLRAALRDAKKGKKGRRQS
jgi:Uma2 family endonuclease